MTRFLTFVIALGLSILGFASVGWGAGPALPDDGSARAAAAQLRQPGRASWHERRYRTRSHLHGPVWDVSLQGRWAVLPTVRLELSAGYGRQRPKAERWRHRNRWVGPGVSVILPLGFNVGIGAEYRWTDYEGNWFPNVRDGSSREDRTRSLRASVHNRALAFWGFSPELVAVNERRTTNAQLYDYKRTRGEVRFVRQF